ncbi:hypothetical protein WJX79_000723 [Trebouxia sp. C0005]
MYHLWFRPFSQHRRYCHLPVSDEMHMIFECPALQASIVKAAFASKDLAAELKKDRPESSHASILRECADERQG